MRLSLWAYRRLVQAPRSEEHTSELQSHHPISYAVFCLKKKIQRPSSTNQLSFCICMEKFCVMSNAMPLIIVIFFFNDTATTEIYTGWYTLSLHDALPI